MISVIGDIMLDEYIYGSSVRQSPECASAPVVVVASPLRMLGGAGNTALNIYHLDSEVILYSSIEPGGKLDNLRCSIDIPIKYTANKSADTVKTRIYSNGNYIARLDIDNKVKHDESTLVADLFSDNTNLIVISDYGKGTITKPQNIISKAKELDIPILVDSKNNLADFKGATVIKPNIKEFFDWLGWQQPNDADEALNRLDIKTLESVLKELEVKHLIITLGDKGCLLVDEYSVKVYPALPIKAIDVTGAGDTFIAALAVAMSEGKDIKRAIQFANRAASIAVTKKGTQYVKRNEI